MSGYLTSGFFKVFVEKVRSVLRKFQQKVLTRDVICGIILLQHRDFGRGLNGGAPYLRYVEFKITSLWDFSGYRIRGREVAKVPIISSEASANLPPKMRKKSPIYPRF
nr:MAG TPA: hypothetical protein [Caudoviricetes sp.]